MCVLLSASVIFSFEVTPAMHAGGQTEPEAGERKEELPLSCSEHIHTLHPGIHGGALDLVTRVNRFSASSSKVQLTQIYSCNSLLYNDRACVCFLSLTVLYRMQK